MQIDLEPKRREPVFQSGGIVRLILLIGLVVGGFYGYRWLFGYFSSLH